MDNRVDARGLSCPQPVVMTKKVLSRNGPGASDSREVLEVLVDNPAAAENVSRFARHSGYDVDVEERSEGEKCYAVRIRAKGRA